MALVPVGHLAGEELGIGAADARPLDIDHGLAGRAAGLATSATSACRGPVMTKALMA